MWKCNAGATQYSPEFYFLALSIDCGVTTPAPYPLRTFFIPFHAYFLIILHMVFSVSLKHAKFAQKNTEKCIWGCTFIAQVGTYFLCLVVFFVLSHLVL